MIVLRSLAFNVLFSAWTLAAFLVGLPALASTQAVHFCARLWVRGILALLAVTVGIRHRCVGLDNRPAGPAIYAFKHQSAWDTLVPVLVLERPAITLKQELLRLPLFGWYLSRSGAIPIDRAAGAKSLRRMIQAAKKATAAGQPLVIYPEGTRVAPGQRLPYRPGVAALYRALDLPVVPVAHNAGLFWGRRAFLKRPGVITLEFLPPIAPGLERAEFMRRLEESMETAANRLIDTVSSAASNRSRTNIDPARPGS
jgi:1-acyl-sn-glycerol-3-phosphate acyltransferase